VNKRFAAKPPLFVSMPRRCTFVLGDMNRCGVSHVASSAPSELGSWEASPTDDDGELCGYDDAYIPLHEDELTLTHTLRTKLSEVAELRNALGEREQRLSQLLAEADELRMAGNLSPRSSIRRLSFGTDAGEAGDSPAAGLEIGADATMPCRGCASASAELAAARTATARAQVEVKLLREAVRMAQERASSAPTALVSAKALGTSARAELRAVRDAARAKWSAWRPKSHDQREPLRVISATRTADDEVENRSHSQSASPLALPGLPGPCRSMAPPPRQKPAAT
jgi:hypothetical protein